MTERDVVSSNATLNAFLGGSRQKSWMIAGGAPVRPTPRRPSITKPSDQPNANNPQRYAMSNFLTENHLLEHEHIISSDWRKGLLIHP